MDQNPGQHLGPAPWEPVLSRNLLGVTGGGRAAAGRTVSWGGAGGRPGHTWVSSYPEVPLCLTPFPRQAPPMLWSHLVCDPRGCPSHHQTLSADGDPESWVPSHGHVLWQNESHGRMSPGLARICLTSPGLILEPLRVSSPQFPTVQPGGLPPWVHGH